MPMDIAAKILPEFLVFCLHLNYFFLSSLFSSAKVYRITASFKISRILFSLPLTLPSLFLKPVSDVMLFMHNCLKFHSDLKQKLGDDNPSGDKYNSRWQLEPNKAPNSEPR